MTARVRVEAKKMPHNASEYERRKNFDNMFKAFKRAVEDYGVMPQCKEHEYYEKPSDKKRRKRRQRLRELEFQKSDKNKLGKFHGKKH